MVLGCSDGSTAIYTNNGQGAFTYAQTLTNTSVSNSSFPFVADLNGDGIPDIGVLQSASIGIYLGTGGGGYAEPFYVGAGASPADAIPMNLHGQSRAAGLSDIMVADLTGRIVTILNTTQP